MSEQFFVGQPPIAVTLRRSARARRFSLRVSSLDGQVTLTLPKRASAREAQAFARDKEPWMRGHLAKRPDQVDVKIGAQVPIEGRIVVLQSASGRAVSLGDGEVFVPAQNPGVRLRAWLKELARQRLLAASQDYADQLGLRFSRITLRDTRSRWGSCTSQGNLMYSWRLILAPPDVLRYVAAHEVCHLRELNHSPAYWALVRQVYPGFEAQRDWLKAQGAGLHRFKFDTSTK